MSREEYIKILNKLLEKTKTFIFSMEVFVFLFFFFIAFMFWLSISLNKTYENHYNVPVKFVNIPKDVEFSADLPTDIDVKLKDKGGVLLTQVGVEDDSLVFDFKKHPEINKLKKLSFQTSTLFEKQLKSKLPFSTVIMEYNPSEIVIEKGVLKSKKVPVVLKSDVTCDDQYCFSGDSRLSPSSVTVYAVQEVIDIVDTLYTEELVGDDLKDTLRKSLRLILPEKCKTDQPIVDAMVPIEIYIEGNIKVPVRVVNVPSQYHIKTLPQEVSVKYNIGKSKYSKVNASSFSLVIDYNDIIDSNSKSQYITVKKAPNGVINYKLSPESVEYIVY